MLHACRIKDGAVSYCNRFVDTFKLAQEKALGTSIYTNVSIRTIFQNSQHVVDMQSLALVHALIPFAVTRNGPIDLKANQSK